MDYSKIYNSIIDNAKVQNRQKYTGEYFEKHHIIPKCMDGNDEKENLVLLTAREHFICHRLLCEMYTDRGLRFAFWGMCNQTFGDVKRDYKISNRTYEYAKKLASIELSKIDRKGEKNSFFGKNHSVETREKWSKLRKGKFWGSFTNHSDETKKTLSEKRIEWAKSKESKKTMSLCNQHRKIVKCTHQDPNLNKEFDTIKDAAKFFDIKYSSMKYILKTSKKCGEYILEAKLANC